jgi:hypothetical protein
MTWYEVAMAKFMELFWNFYGGREGEQRQVSVRAIGFRADI